MKCIETPFPEVKVFEIKTFGDSRGHFFEGYSAKRYEEFGIPTNFVQDNYSVSQKNVLRGMHFQNPNAQGKLVGVLAGSVYDVAVDLRQNSKTFGKWFGIELSKENRLQMYVPPGFAHGFLALEDNTMFYYKCTDFYSPSSERSLLWNDADVGIQWPTKEPLLSPKDAAALSLKQFSKDQLYS